MRVSGAPSFTVLVKGGSFLTTTILGGLEFKPAPLEVTRVRHPNENIWAPNKWGRNRLPSGALNGQNLVNGMRD
jgi:hypothetical protein